MRNNNAIAYADDLTFILLGALQNDVERNMQALLDQVSQWASEFQLSVNTDKCFVLPVDSAAKPSLPQQARALLIGDVLLPNVDDIKILDVKVSCHLSWSAQI